DRPVGQGQFAFSDVGDAAAGLNVLEVGVEGTVTSAAQPSHVESNPAEAGHRGRVPHRRAGVCQQFGVYGRAVGVHDRVAGQVGVPAVEGPGARASIEVQQV